MRTSTSEVDVFRAETFMEALQKASAAWFKGSIVKDWRKVSSGSWHYKLLRDSRNNKTIGTVVYLGDK